jgi:hypothetical protein
MNRLPPLFSLQSALRVLAERTNVLPAVGGATEDELHPDADEIEDARINGSDELLDEPWERGNTNTYVTLTPAPRWQDHCFRFFQDGSMRTFFVGNALEHDRQTPVVIGQVGCATLERLDDGRMQVARHDQRNLLLVAFSQVSEAVRDALAAQVTQLGPQFVLGDIEAGTNATKDLRARANDAMRAQMAQTESDALVAAAQAAGNAWLIYDGSIRFAKYEQLKETFGDGQPPVVSVAKNFSKKPRFKIGRGARSREVNLWQLLAELPEGNRTIAFKAKTRDFQVGVWYLRLRQKARMEFPLMGVIKVELPSLNAEPPSSELVNRLSNALLAERTVTPHGLDRRWHAHLYPVFQAERCVKNGFVSISTLRAGLHWPHPTPSTAKAS